ncbi:phage integrase SAM-like domain-containing protein [Alistipes sp.]|uniref:phage integrase SAM-like domain-containing protein n=1 Tax=Alistipes sp. TaxID=1872444 RepID=UPI003AB6A39F
MKYAKDGITVEPIHDTRREMKNGAYPIKIRITYKRERRYYPTGKTLTVNEWNALPTTKVRTLIATRKDIENSYNIVRDTVEDLASSSGFTFDALNNRLKRGAGITLNAAFKAKIEDLRGQERVGSMLVYNVVLQGVERFAGNHVAMDIISVEWVRRYERFLVGEGKSRTTIGIHMRHLRAILNDACRCGLIKEAQYPFGRGRYEIQAGEGRKMALTLEQIGQIARYDDGNKLTAQYRDYWLFLYLCNGINVADFVKLRYRDIVNGEICFVRQKTERTTKTRHEIRVIITERMQSIIEQWGNPPAPDSFIFPILDGTEDAFKRKTKTVAAAGAINVRMRTIGKALGIGNISTYTARHSFATVLKRAGANIAYISESLGHQDLKTTENYLASFEREERQKNAELLTKF